MESISDRQKELQPIQISTGKRLLCNKGASLIEVVVSIAILGIVLLPILNSFAIAARSNAESKRVQTQNMVVQDILEEMKGKAIEDIISEYNNIGDDYYELSARESGVGYEIYSSNIFTKKDFYYLLKRNIDNKYDALITFDASAYGNIPLATDYNDYQMPLIRDINSSEHLVAIQSYETEMAVSVLYANHVSYCIGVGTECIPLDISVVENSIERNIRVVISLSGSNILAAVELVYSSSVDGCGMVTYQLATKQLSSADKGIYVFYQAFPNDLITISNSSGQVMDVFAFEQSSPAATISVNKPTDVNLYSNIPGYMPVKKKEENNRIFDIKVQLFSTGINFDPGDVYIPGDLYAELQSTKGE